MLMYNIKCIHSATLVQFLAIQPARSYNLKKKGKHSKIAIAKPRIMLSIA